jgi:hypothetical protein
MIVYASGKLDLRDADGPPALSVRSRSEPAAAQLRLVLETGAVWTIALDPAEAAYVAGTLAHVAGVQFG